MLLTQVAPAEIGIDSQRLQIVYDLLRNWTQGPDAPIPGAALIVGRANKTVAPQFFGHMGPEPDAPPLRRDAVFLLASVSKPVTYLAAMILVERGLMCLSDPVIRFIREFNVHGKDEILIHHLCTHTSGLPDMLKNNLELRKEHAPLEKFLSAVIRDTVPLFKPGTDFSYQSMGTLVVAEIIQRITGMPFRDFVRKEILEPLGLTTTRFGSQGIAVERLARNHTPSDHQPEFGWNSTYWRELGSPWGGMFSTPDEYAVICNMMLSGGRFGGKQLLSPATIQLMTTNRLDDYPDIPENVRRTSPWGLGCQLNHPGDQNGLCELLGRHVYGHWGSTGGLVWMDPHTEAFCVLMSTYEYERAPWRMMRISNAVAAAFL